VSAHEGTSTVTSPVVVATANVLYTLGAGSARRALAGVLEHEPDLVALQEWHLSRWRLLRETGDVGVVPQVGGRLRRTTARSAPGYLWNSPPMGGCAVGARADRYELVWCRSRVLSAPGRADHPDRVLGVEPPRVATVAVYRDRSTGRRVSLVDYHLAPGVQARGRYRVDRPRLERRHRREVGALERLVGERLAAGDVVFAAGDSNFDGLRIAGLTSAWEGREHEPGTLGGRRKIDDVHGVGPAESVVLLRSDSDHKAVLVRRAV
jgi:hypothetical protein